MGDKSKEIDKKELDKVFDSPWAKVGAKRGAKPKPIDWKTFSRMCEEQCTKIEMALEFGVDPTTLENKIKEKYNMNFSTLFEIKRTAGIRSLRSLNFALARAGDRGMAKHVYGLYSHKDPNIDPRAYGGDPAPREGDHKIDITVSFVEAHAKSVDEALEIEKIKDEN